MDRILNSLKLSLNTPNIVIILWLCQRISCSQEMTVEVFVTMSSVHSQMVQKNYVCVYKYTYTCICIHTFTLYAHMHIHLYTYV